MQMGIVGLGRMGASIARRVMNNGHTIVGFDRQREAVAELVSDGAEGATSLADLRARLQSPAVIWVMLPAGEPTESTITELTEICKAGDILVDGGNSHFKDDIIRYRALATHGIRYIDVGTSGGVFGLDRGFCLMIGGDPDVVSLLDPIFSTLAPGHGDAKRTSGRDGSDGTAELGYIHAGPVGAGHFLKMVHNGIEYGLMQAYAEGFDILRSRMSANLPLDERFEYDLADVAEVWRRGSIISSWLLDLCAEALAADHTLDSYSGSVSDSGEGRWTVEAAMEAAVPANVLTAALYARYRSRVERTLGEKLLSTMRFGFGKHLP